MGKVLFADPLYLLLINISSVCHKKHQLLGDNLGDWIEAGAGASG